VLVWHAGWLVRLRVESERFFAARTNFFAGAKKRKQCVRFAQNDMLLARRWSEGETHA
jgi:hypothetical protein